MAKKPRRKKKTLEEEIHNVADRKSPVFSASYVNDIDGFVGDIPFDTIRDLIDQGALNAVQFAIPWDELEDTLANGQVGEEIVSSLKQTADKTSAATNKAVRDALGVQPTLTFDANNPRVERFLRKRIGSLVTDISNSGKKSIQDIIVQASMQETDPDAIINRIKQSIGIRNDQLRAVANFEEGLRQRGLREELVKKRSETFARKQLGQRADLIARTEMMTAANAGNQLGWEQARDEGLFSNEDLRGVEWVTSEDELVCPTCRPMNGVIRPLDGTWEVQRRTSNGAITGTVSITIPNQAHPRCRCTSKLVFK